MALPAVVEGLHLGQPVVFGVLAGAAMVQWRRRGHAEGAWLALMFCFLAIILVAGSLPWYPDDPAHPAHVPITRVLAAMIVCVPYLQYRFMAAFSPSRRGEHAAVGGTTAALVTVVMLLPGFPAAGMDHTAAFTVLVAAVLVQWVTVIGLVAVRLWRAGRTQGVVARARMRTLATGSLGLAVSLVISQVGHESLDVARSLLTLASGGVLLAGFAPPRPLRALWRSREEQSSAQVKRALVEAADIDAVAGPCAEYASRLFGGRAAVLLDGSGVVLGMHGVDGEQARELASRVPAAVTERGIETGRRDQRTLTVACRSGWLAVEAGPYTPFFGGDETLQLQSVAALAELALDRVALHEQVRRNHRQLSDAQALAQVGSWEWDLASDTVHWSPELYRLHGIQPEAEGFRYADVLALVHPDDRAAFEQTVRAACETREPFTIEHRAVQPDGTVVLLHAHGKPVSDDGGRLVGLLGACQDVTERRRLEAEVAHRALHDPVTDLANRTLFTERLGHALARRERVAAPMAVLFLDLDDFKSVNDRFGHGVGDELLQAVGKSLQGLVRSVDTVARLGGDEFGILLEDLDVLGATALAERIQGVLARPLFVEGREIVARVSIGIVVDAGAASAEEILRNADSAMYAAKGAGKGAYRLFDEGMHVELSRRLELRADLQRAIAGGELRLRYQPVVSLADGAVTAVEALVRWQHPTRGLMGPSDFIPLAEESGLIVALGDWVLCEAVAQLRTWQDTLSGLGPLGLHVNVSARQLHEPDVVERFAEVLAGAGVDPGLLTVEITESVLMGESDVSVARLWELRRLGIRVAIDDFGTGYSSLSYLQRLPIDTLKIDKAFVDGVTGGPEDEALAHAIVRIAGTLRLAAVAEGVETATQARRLHAMGCASAQGYFYAPPLTSEDLVELLEAAPAPLRGSSRPAQGLRSTVGAPAGRTAAAS